MPKIDVLPAPTPIHEEVIERGVLELHRDRPEPSPDESLIAERVADITNIALDDIEWVLMNESLEVKMPFLKLILNATLRKTVADDSGQYDDLRLAWERTAAELRAVPAIHDHMLDDDDDDVLDD